MWVEKSKKLKTYFNLDRPYEFDITDLTALIYTACAIGVMCGANMTMLFLIGSLIATAFCWQARRINLIVLNGALLILNIYNFIQMIIGG
jgi:hypothetical protein